jgi:hypothetical protein
MSLYFLLALAFVTKLVCLYYYFGVSKVALEHFAGLNGKVVNVMAILIVFWHYPFFLVIEFLCIKNWSEMEHGEKSKFIKYNISLLAFFVIAGITIKAIYTHIEQHL